MNGMKASTKIAVVALALLALVVLFPPVDYFRPGKEGVWIGGSQTTGYPDSRTDMGFTFIGEVGGAKLIRYQQWYSMMAVVTLIGAAGFGIASRKG